MKAEIRMHNGRPAVFVNGELCTPMMATLRTYEDNGRHNIDEEYYRMLGEAGIRVFFLICDTVCLKPDAVELFNEEAEILLRAVPDAYIIARIGLHPTNEWIEKNPDECVLYSDGSSPAVKLWTESYTATLPRHYSLASQAWRESAGNALKETWQELMKLSYADRIIGCFLGAGGTSEWYYMIPVADDNRHIALGHSKAFKKEFTKYLTKIYGTDEALRKAWRDSLSTLENPKIPDYEAHYFATRVDNDTAAAMTPPNGPVPPSATNGTNVGAFVDMDKNKAVYDFYRAWHNSSASSVLYFANVIKTMTPNRLVGAFYGSQGCIHYIKSGSNGATRRILESNLVDFLAAPGVYENRAPGGSTGQRAVQDSFALHNKIYIVEDDVRTLAENRFLMDKAEIYDMTDTLNVMKREFGRNICEDVQSWWFDQCQSRPRYKYPEILSLMKRQQEIAKEAYTFDRRKNSEIALIFDEESFQAASIKTTLDSVELLRNYELARIGAPADQYYHDDMLNPDMPSYKLYIFVNTFVLTEEERNAIRAKLKRDGAVAVWLHASGLIDPDADQKLSAENISKLIGIEIDSVNEKFDAVFRFNGEEHQISKAFDPRRTYGKFTRRPSMMITLPKDAPQYLDTYLYPLFYSKDKEAKNLAYLLTSGYPAVSLKECDGFTSIFYASKSIRSEVIREIARFAGCHIYTESDEVIYINSNYITYHADSTGKKRIKLPYRASVYEVYEQKLYASSVNEFEFDAYLGETKMFRINKEK